MDCCSSCTKLLMLLMENKQEERVPLVHWESFLIMDVMLLHVVIGVWKHCYVRADHLLVLGYISGSFLLCYMGTLFYQYSHSTSYKRTYRRSYVDIYDLFTTFVGAKWWAQPFRKSVPFLDCLPFVSEITMHRAVLFLMIAFAVIPTVSFNFTPLLCSWLEFLCGTYPHLVIVGTGLAFGFLVSLFYLPFAIANSLTARLNDGVPLVNEFWVLLGYFICTVALYLHFDTSVIHEITSALGIYCFRITRKEACASQAP